MGRHAVEVHADDVDGLVAADHAHAGGLPHDAAARVEAGFGDGGDKVDGAEAADFLVVGEGQVDGFVQFCGGDGFELGHDDSNEGLHVAGAAGVELAVADLRA